jgi:SpoVK/Ycf46/Vps4 family AAA+-type ATPase
MNNGPRRSSRFSGDKDDSPELEDRRSRSRSSSADNMSGTRPTRSSRTSSGHVNYNEDDDEEDEDDEHEVESRNTRSRARQMTSSLQFHSLKSGSRSRPQHSNDSDNEEILGRSRLTRSGRSANSSSRNNDYSAGTSRQGSRSSTRRQERSEEHQNPTRRSLRSQSFDDNAGENSKEEEEEEEEEEEAEEEEELNDSDENEEEQRRYPRRHAVGTTAQRGRGRPAKNAGTESTSGGSSSNTSDADEIVDQNQEEDAEENEGRRYPRRSTRVSVRLQHNDEESDEEEEERAGARGGSKYSFRNRDRTRRDVSTLNVSRLGGEGGGLSRSSSSVSGRARRSYSDSGASSAPPKQRHHFSQKLPNWNAKRQKSSNRHQHSGSNVGYRKHFDSSSDSSSSNGGEKRNHNGNASLGRRSRANSAGHSDEDTQFHQHEKRRLEEERDSIQPINFISSALDGGLGGSVKDKASRRDLLRADVTPVAVDPKLGFDSVGGLDNHIAALKEMVVLPLLYPDVFARFDTQPPRGVLFVGPPGTGKTLTARALANSLSATASNGGRKISFFMRKGADCLSKWVGEGERQLRLLFEQAKRFQPSIIFFDEIDGLAPVRSVKQDQIHASIVSTLLALMDGLDSRGQVVVIGATNRPDAIDAALRRAGRFDRELVFPLPNASARRAILDIHTAKWEPPLSNDMKDWIVHATKGYCGADMKAFCAEAAVIALRRTFPQVYESDYRLALDHSVLSLKRGDFAAALNKIVASSARSINMLSRPLVDTLLPLLHGYVDAGKDVLEAVFPAGIAVVNKDKRMMVYSSKHDGRSDPLLIQEDSDEWIAALVDSCGDGPVQHPSIPLSNGHLNGHSNGSTGGKSNAFGQDSWLWDARSISSFPRLMLTSKPGFGHEDIAAAIIHYLESLPCLSIDISTLISDYQASSPEQALVNKVQDAMKQAPSIIYLPDVRNWWRSASESLRNTLMSIIRSMSRATPVLWLSTLVESNGTSSSSRANGFASPLFATNLSPSPGYDDHMHAHHIENHYDEMKLKELIQWLGGGESSSCSSPHTLQISTPTAAARKEFFASLTQTLYQLPERIFTARHKILLSRSHQLTIDQMTPENAANSSAVSTGTHEQHQMDEDNTFGTSSGTADRDHQCLREQRTFFRAAITELLKENKFKVFCRPVDPEAVPDYYDVITFPMDMETMRMKVDAQMYPTLDHFMRDIDQIVFNAKAYNPMTRDDHRGRSIVHSAHGMLDLIESHAFNFQKEIGYDLFGQCKAIARRKRVPAPLPPPNVIARKQATTGNDDADGDIWAENRIFYADMLARHIDLKQQREEELDSQQEVDDDMQIEEESSRHRHRQHIDHSKGNSHFRDRSWNDDAVGGQQSSTRSSIRRMNSGSEGNSEAQGPRATRSRSAPMNISIEALTSELDGFLHQKKKRKHVVDEEAAAVGDSNDSSHNNDQLEGEDVTSKKKVRVVDSADDEQMTTEETAGETAAEITDDAAVLRETLATEEMSVAASALQPVAVSASANGSTDHLLMTPKLTEEDIANCPLLKNLKESMLLVEEV